MWLDSCQVGKDPATRSCRHGNEPLDSTTCGEILDWLSCNQHLKNSGHEVTIDQQKKHCTMASASICFSFSAVIQGSNRRCPFVTEVAVLCPRHSPIKGQVAELPKRYYTHSKILCVSYSSKSLSFRNMAVHRRLRTVDQHDLPSDLFTAVLTGPTLIFCC